MIRQTPRCLFRAPIISLRSAPTRRFLSTAPPTQKSRSWKNKATRLGLAVGVIYYYNTSTLFAEEPPFAVPAPSSPSEETSLPTLESVKLERQKSSVEPETLEEREQEAEQEGAFNEETGEINWDCPCLGGMAHGPCGEQFKAAFSCFVFSKEEPKGMDCIDNFKTMQTCFREYPDIYGSELEGEEEEDDAPPDEAVPSPSPIDPTERSIPAAATSAIPEPQSPPGPSSSEAGSSDTERARAATQQVERDHGDVADESDAMLVPKAAHEAAGHVSGK